MFTPWMPILQQGAAGAVAPYAIWVAPLTDYSATGWHKCQWRFDTVTGEVEYRGLAKTTGAVASTALRVIECYMAVTPMLPKPTLHFMSQAMTSHTPALARNSAIVRWDLRAPTATEHHSLYWELTGANAVGTGSWVFLNGRWSLATTQPSGWSPWAVMKASGYAGTEIHARWGTATLDNYNTWRPVEWRYNGQRIQLRGLGKTTAAQAAGDPIVIFHHPRLILPTRRIILPEMVNYSDTDGIQEMVRTDIVPRANGFSLNWNTGAWAPNTAYFWLDLDLDLSFFTSGG